MLNNFLLGAIALGLWANIATTIVRPAISADNTTMEMYLASIDRSMTALVNGGLRCRNTKICD